MVELVDHVRLGRAEAAREGEELRRRECLRAHHEHLAVVEGVLDLANSAPRKAGQDRAQDLGTEAVAERSYLEHGLVGRDHRIESPGMNTGLTAERNPNMKLVTWNTQWCCGLDGTAYLRRIVEGARQLADFDVLCLKEVSQGFDGLVGHTGRPANSSWRRCCLDSNVFFGAATDEFSPEGQAPALRQPGGHATAGDSRAASSRCRGRPTPVSNRCRACAPWSRCRSPLLGDVRVMTTHLEYYSAPQRLAQARAVRALHDEACALAATPPKALNDGSAFQGKRHTPHALLCGDFNATGDDPAIAAIAAPDGAHALRDAWPLVHGQGPRAPTFRVFDHTYGDKAVVFDFVFVSAGLAERVRRVDVDVQTRASDHQPVVVEFADAAH